MAARKRAKTKTKAPARKRAGVSSNIADALAEAAWSEADRALAQVVTDFLVVRAAKRAKERNEAILLLGQSLQRTMRRRGLVILGEADAIEAYDPARHAYSGGRAPKRVRIVTPGVARDGEVLVKAQAGPVGKLRPRERA